MSDELKAQVTLTSPARINFPQVFEPKGIPTIPNSKEVYSARFVLPSDHPDLKTLLSTSLTILRKMHAASDEAGEELGKLTMSGTFSGGRLRAYKDFWWPFETGDMRIAKSMRTAEQKGKEYKDYDGYMAGKVTLYAKAYPEYPPQVDFAENGRWVKITPENRSLHKSKFYNGMEALGSVTIAGTKTAQGWGVSCYLNGLAATGGGERIGGRTEVNWGALPGISSSPEELDDDIPF